MRTRDSKKLKPGTRIELTNKAANYVLKYWEKKKLYFHSQPGLHDPHGYLVTLRSSKRITDSTTYGVFFPKEIKLAKDES